MGLRVANTATPHVSGRCDSGVQPAAVCTGAVLGRVSRQRLNVTGASNGDTVPEAGQMARKHTWYDRRRMTKRRPMTRAPTNGSLIADLMRMTGVPVRTIRYYVAHDVIQPLERRGTLTRYPRRELLRLLGTVRLLGDRLTLAQAKKRLDALGNPELEVWVREYPLPRAVLAALDADAAGHWPPERFAAAANVAKPVPAVAAQPLPVQSARPAEDWHRAELLPGLSLHWPANAGGANRGGGREDPGDVPGVKSSSAITFRSISVTASPRLRGLSLQEHDSQVRRLVSQSHAEVRKHFTFADHLFRKAASDLKNAFYVSYLEHLNFAGHRAFAEDLLPPALHAGWLEINAYLDNLSTLGNNPKRT